MAISINPVLPVLPAQEAGSVAPELVLQPGSVVNAQVLKVLSADLVRIAIASLSIDVASEIPLQQGQNLQLAVSQTKDGGIRLAVVGQGGDASARPTPSRLSPDALADAPASRPTIVVTEERADAAGARSRLHRRPGRGDRAGQPGAAVCQSRRGGFLKQSAAEAAAGDSAGAGAADQPRSEPRRRRHQDGVPEIRDFSRGVAGGGIGSAERRSRSQGGADRASPDAAVGTRRQFERSRRRSTPAGGAASRVATDRRLRTLRRLRCRSPMCRKSCCRRRDCPSPANLAAAGQAARNPLAAALDAGPSAGATLNLLQEALQELGNPARGDRHAERRAWRRT